MTMPEQVMPLQTFMGRFGEQLFDKAGERGAPEYNGGRDDLDRILVNRKFGRIPFPAQSEAVKALYSHLFEHDAKMAFAVGEMGTGKTTIASMVASMPATPQRVVCTVPPHLVSKWAREIKMIVPNAKVFKINSGGANRILGQQAEKNPGRPEQPEFYIIGRVRLRMDYRVQSALQTRGGNGYRFQNYCSCCGHRPVREIKLKDDEEMPPDAVVSDNTADEEVDTSDHVYVNILNSDVKRGTTCDMVATRSGEIQEGCGSALWQATRNRKHSRDSTLVKGFEKLPGVGRQKAERLAQAPGAWEAAEALENGDVPTLVQFAVGKIRLARIRKWLEKNEFSLDANDYAPVAFIKNRLPRYWFDLAIFDEIHEYRGDSTAQGVAFGILAGASKKVLNLTGTLIDGYAASLHPLLFRADPKRMIEAGFGAEDAARFQWQMGVIKEIQIETESSDLSTARSRKRIRKQKKNLPGLHPKVITDLLLPNAVFVTLADIEASIQSLQPEGEEPARLLPSYREVYVSPAMAGEQRKAIQLASAELTDILKKALAKGGGQSLLSPIISALLRYPDDCWRPLCVQTRGAEVPLFEADAVPMPADGCFPKDKFMQDLVKREIAQGRRVVIYTTYTNKRDLASYYSDVCKAVGAQTAVLRSSVPADQREIWIEQQVNDGVDVIVCNPELVKTGLDLFEFPTMLFMQTGYTTDTILQAARRSWRIGQQHPVRVYFAGYADSEYQVAALRLMAKKIRVANQAKGDISESGLSSLDDDEDASAMQMLANSILDKRRDRTHDTITGAITSIDEDDCSEEFVANSLDEIASIIQKSHSRMQQKMGVIADPVEVEAHEPTVIEATVEEMPLSETPTPQPEPVAIPSSPNPGGRKVAESTVEVLVAYTAKKKRSRKKYAPPQSMAIEDVPEGAQFALF